MLDVFLSLDRCAGRIENFEIDELVDPVIFRVPLCEPILVLINAPGEIVRDADIERAAGPARKNVQIELSHRALVSWPALCRPSRFSGHRLARLSGIAGTSPAMTTRGDFQPVYRPTE